MADIFIESGQELELDEETRKDIGDWYFKSNYY
jgi:hypothetical protein